MKPFQTLAVLGAGALALINFSAVMPAAISVSAAENDPSWEFDEATGTLTISGAWENFFFFEDNPWLDLRNNQTTPVRSVVFAEGTKSIPENALPGFKSLKSVTIPEGTEIIGSSAFTNCTALEQITLPDSLTEIGDSAFRNCTALKQITLPDSLTEIGYLSFQDCTSLKSVAVPENVTLIGSSAFRNCTALKDVTFSGNPVEFGANPFEETPWLADRRAENPLVIAGGILIDGVTCKGVVQIPDGVTMIGHYAFQKNEEMTEVIIPDSVTSLGAKAFSECSALKKAFIPKQIETVSDSAFSHCVNLKSVVMEEGVKVIGDNAFSFCEQLTDIVIPETVNRIETFSLRGTPWMQNKQKENPLVIVNHILVDGTCCTGDVVIPEDVVRLSPYVFYPLSSGTCLVKSVVIPDGVTEIPFCAFSGCAELTSVTIPDTVERIVHNAFTKCEQLKELTIPASVRDFGSTVFWETNLTIRGYKGSAAETYAKENNIPFTVIGSDVPEQTEALCGDANADGSFDVSDAVLVSRFLIEDKNAVITDAGRLNADVTGDGAVQPDDVTVMLQRIARQILTFPAEEMNKAE